MTSDVLPLNLKVLLVAAPTVASLGIVWPFCGALVRYRANNDGYPDDACSSRLTGVLASLRRTWRLEGLRGLYKGALPTLAYTASYATAAWIWIAYSPNVFRFEQMPAPLRWAIHTVWFAAVSLPSTLILDRCIVAPHTLPYDIRRALRLLLSHEERKAPLSMYTKASLFLAHLFLNLPFSAIAHAAGLPVLLPIFTSKRMQLPAPEALLLALGCHAVWAAFTTPLEVISTRLSLQGFARSTHPEPNMGKEAAMSREHNDEDNGLYTQSYDEAYDGIGDCARKIVGKEGVRSLWRGYIWEVIGRMFTAVR